MTGHFPALSPLPILCSFYVSQLSLHHISQQLEPEIGAILRIYEGALKTPTDPFAMPSSSPGLHMFIGAVHDDWQMFSDDPDDYQIGLPIGFGATSIVYAGRYKPKDSSNPLPCAVKVVNLDRLPLQSLRLLRRETQLMSLSKHPNLLRVRGSWTTGHNLHIALRLMNSGSAADVMHYGWPGGMEEEVVKCILKQTLEGLNYLHINGFIHRDVKAANLLIDDDGTVLLGDLGVAAALSDEEPIPAPSGSGQRMSFNGPSASGQPYSPVHVATTAKFGKRKSFVGTPCWMAPELISGKQYDAKADIWSFGITAIELTHGRAPRSREAPGRVLVKTVQDAPPEFARESGHYKFSKSFKEIVEACVSKDPSRRPSAVELLDTPFFKSAKRKSYLVNTILKDLPPLIHRQERHVKVSDSLTDPNRNSMSSWDFTMELPHSPSGLVRSQHNTGHPAFNAAHSHHNTVSSPTRLDALEENIHADVFEQLKAAQPDPALSDPQVRDAGGESRTSMESSVFDVEEIEDESNPTTPEPLASAAGGSSLVTAPLSCSPATTLGMPVQASNCATTMGGQSVSKPVPSTAPFVSAAAGELDRPEGKPSKDSVRRQSAMQQGLHQRRGSSPAATLNRAKPGALPVLKRIANASSRSKSYSKESNLSQSSEYSPMESPGVASETGAEPVTMQKESRWRKLMRSTGGKGVDSATPSTLMATERRKSTLGRLLERTGR